MKLTLRLIEIESEALEAALARLNIEPAAVLALLNLPAPAPRANAKTENAAATAIPPRISPPAEIAAAPVRTTRKAPRRPMNGTQPRPEPDAPPAKAAHGETQNRILHLLAKEPLTSGELIARSKLSPASVYSVLTALRAAKRIDTRDDGEGIRKNFFLK